MSAIAIVPPATASPADPRTARTYLVFLVIALVAWGEAAYRQGGDMAAGRHLSPMLVAGAMVLGRVLTSAVEALAYTLWWRTRGARLPFGRYFVAVVVLSLADLVALALAAQAARTPELAPWLAPVAGLHLLKGWLHDEAGLRAAFGSLSLLTLVRIGLTAWLQAAALQRRLGGVLLVIGGAWLLTRLLLWWTTDLLRGTVPVP